MGLSPAGGCNGGGRITRGGDLGILSLERSHTFYCDHAHYGPLSGGVEGGGIKGGQEVVGCSPCLCSGIGTPPLDYE